MIDKVKSFFKTVGVFSVGAVVGHFDAPILALIAKLTS